MHRSLQEWANGRGYRIAWGCPEVVDEVRSEVDRRREAGSEYVRELLDVFSYLKNEKLPQANAVVVVAVPRAGPSSDLRHGQGRV